MVFLRQAWSALRIKLTVNSSERIATAGRIDSTVYEVSRLALRVGQHQRPRALGETLQRGDRGLLADGTGVVADLLEAGGSVAGLARLVTLAGRGWLDDRMAMHQTTPLITLVFAILLTFVRSAGAVDEADTDAAAREALFNKTEAAAVSQRMRVEPLVTRSFTARPADTYAREPPFWRGLAKPQAPTERTCALHPADCYDLCVGWANGPACFDLAQAYEHHSLDVADELDRQRFYSLACAMGFAAGCTNRAAGIRNGGYREDPFRDTPLVDKWACEYRSFLIDCDQRGAWGCAMLGQAYRNGEGVAAQPERARAAFEASCAISPKFAACAFAKRQLERMDRPLPLGSDNAGSAD